MPTPQARRTGGEGPTPEQQFCWHGRQQLAEAIPPGDRDACAGKGRYDGCEGELCYCVRCVVPESYSAMSFLGWFCHACLKDILGWGPGRRLHHCSTCTCREQ